MRVLVLAAVAGMTLSGAPAPPAELACKRDADCDSTHYTAECCVVCGYTAGSREHIRKLIERCQANPNRKCPPYDCPPMDPAVVCADGACRLKARQVP